MSADTPGSSLPSLTPPLTQAAKKNSRKNGKAKNSRKKNKNQQKPRNDPPQERDHSTAAVAPAVNEDNGKDPATDPSDTEEAQNQSGHNPPLTQITPLTPTTAHNPQVPPSQVPTWGPGGEPATRNNRNHRSNEPNLTTPTEPFLYLGTIFYLAKTAKCPVLCIVTGAGKQLQANQKPIFFFLPEPPSEFKSVQVGCAVCFIPTQTSFNHNSRRGLLA